jgi:hypothetical protein
MQTVLFLIRIKQRFKVAKLIFVIKECIDHFLLSHRKLFSGPSQKTNCRIDFRINQKF